MNENLGPQIASEKLNRFLVTDSAAAGLTTDDALDPVSNINLQLGWRDDMEWNGTVRFPDK